VTSIGAAWTAFLGTGLLSAAAVMRASRVPSTRDWMLPMALGGFGISMAALGLISDGAH
jgi:hypothetical protein